MPENRRLRNWLFAAFCTIAVSLSVQGNDTTASPASVLDTPVSVEGDGFSFTDQYRFENPDTPDSDAGVLHVGGGAFTYTVTENYTVSRPVYETVHVLKRVRGEVQEVTRTVKRMVSEERTRAVSRTVHLPAVRGYWLADAEPGTVQWTFYRKLGTGYVLGTGTTDGASLEGIVWYVNVRGIPDGSYQVTNATTADSDDLSSDASPDDGNAVADLLGGKS